MSNCSERDRLATDLDQTLKDMAERTALLKELLRSKQYAKFSTLDKELELLVGQKERAVGSLRQHIHDHKCDARDL